MEQRPAYGKPSPLAPLREAIAAAEISQEAIANLPASIGPIKLYLEEHIQRILFRLRRCLENEEAAALEARTT